MPEKGFSGGAISKSQGLKWPKWPRNERAGGRRYCMTRNGYLFSVALGVGENALQSEMLLECIKVTITVQQRMPIDDAASSKCDVDRASNSDPELAKLQVVPCCRHNHVRTTENDKLKPAKQAPDIVELLFDPAALENLDEIKVTDSKYLRIEQILKESRL